MNTIISKITIAALLSGFSLFAVAGEIKDASSGNAKENKIEIKDFAFNPQNITVKSGEMITWINRDEEPHTVVSVGVLSGRARQSADVFTRLNDRKPDATLAAFLDATSPDAMPRDAR